jgi:hypothetical protein
MATTPPAKPKKSTLAWTLVILGMGLFSIEQFGLDKIEGPNKAVHLDPNLLSVLVIAPFALVIAGAVVFMVGRMRRR